MATAAETGPERKELKPGWKNEVEVKTIKQVDVAKHNTKKDLWMSIHGKVYDLTEYARDHPGGLDTLLEVSGTDATSAFEDVGHSEDAREILHSYLVGVVEGAKAEDPSKPAPALPEVKKVKRTAPPTDHGSDLWTALVNPRTELAASAVAAAILAWSVNRFGLIPVHVASNGSFTQGFLIACVTFSVVGLASLRYLENMTNIRSFTTYSQHKRSTVQRRGSFHPSGVLTPQEYQKFKLRSKTELSPGIWSFVFDLPTAWSILGLPIGQHVAIKAEIDGHTVVRSYTPVSNNRDLGRLELLIRVYPDGQLGNFLKNLEVGSEADMRGPKGAMKYRKGLCKTIGMVAGGTGITPMFQVIRAICEDKNDDTQVSLIYANRSEADIMLRDKLDLYARVAPNKFKVYYVLDNPPAGWKGGEGRVSKDTLEERLPKPAKDARVFLCGPPGMVNGTKDTLTSLGFEAPGAVSKITDQIFCF